MSMDVAIPVAPPVERERAESASPARTAYERYHIATATAPNRAAHPTRFKVHVRRHRLALLLVKELVHYRANMPVVLSRPCVYGVFSGPLGGFMAREQHCVGCLRCTTQYPDVVQIEHNPERQQLGDSYLTPNLVDTITYEVQSGSIPVRGAGYRGRFGGEGWDGMWTDMSEIVRPTRDGIHGREFISTAVDLGEKPSFLTFDEQGEPQGALPRMLTLPLPMLFDAPPLSAPPALLAALAEAARAAHTLVIAPLAQIAALPAAGAHVAPLVAPGEAPPFAPPLLCGGGGGGPALVELAAWDEALAAAIRTRFPEALLALRLPFAPGCVARMLAAVHAGVRVIHLTADYHGHGADGRFALELIREAHLALVSERLREEVTLIGSGGIVAAEHVPKSILCGLDAVALDTPALVALQARFVGECVTRETARIELPALESAWAVQRLQNLLGSWRDQLLEILGAMGLREVRRMRGEMGRAMFEHDLEREAFEGISGYAD
jgi:hypothetical protein